MKTEIKESGKVIVTEAPASGGIRSWKCSNPDQACKMLPTWESAMPKGDATAIRDCNADYASRDGTSAVRVSQSWVYVNGEAIEKVIDGEPVAAAPALVADARARSILDYLA